MKKRLTLAALATILAVPAFAGGYQVSLQGQKQIGMGHTGTALAWDASSIFFNPGSLGFLKKSSVLGGASFISSTVGYAGGGTSTYKTETNNPLGTPFAAYGAFLVGPSKRLVIGAAVYTPYGSTVRWGDSWRGNALLQSLKLEAINTNVTVAYRVTDMISIGGGFNYAFGSVDLKRAVSPVYTSDGFGQVQLKGSASGIGFNAGIHVQATEKFSVGVSYRHQLNMKVTNGDATVTASSAALNGSTFPVSTGGDPNSSSTKFKATLPLPGVVSVGVGYKATDNLTLAADVNYTLWSAYKELKFDFDQPFGNSTSTASPRNYKNAFAYRIGADYKVADAFSVRAGGYFDQTPVQAGYMSAETPDANRFGISIGAGVKPVAGLFIDASLLLILGQKRTQTEADVTNSGTQDAALPGVYQQRAIIPGIQVGYEF